MIKKLLLNDLGINLIEEAKKNKLDPVEGRDKETKRLISVEDHNIIGGLGSIIADVLTESYPCKLTKMGINDRFGESGKANVLLEKYKIDSKAIINEVKKG